MKKVLFIICFSSAVFICAADGGKPSLEDRVDSLEEKVGLIPGLEIAVERVERHVAGPSLEGLGQRLIILEEIILDHSRNPRHKRREVPLNKIDAYNARLVALEQDGARKEQDLKTLQEGRVKDITLAACVGGCVGAGCVVAYMHREVLWKMAQRFGDLK